ncbi:rho GTPase-activating protein 23 isoform X2 [Lates japonicus]|uniref:Rho GTPase-activating protein 23 isoform X2 n=1 Tax=Lates japonicus TaxID=270547 RepID=A0AAD3M874_LATJO|nr:rho GTPase-activating protein 23 isoform X2 [Lates japonicus]
MVLKKFPNSKLSRLMDVADQHVQSRAQAGVVQPDKEDSSCHAEMVVVVGFTTPAGIRAGLGGGGSPALPLLNLPTTPFKGVPQEPLCQQAAKDNQSPQQQSGENHISLGKPGQRREVGVGAREGHSLVCGCSLLIPSRALEGKRSGASPRIPVTAGLTQSISGTYPAPEAVCQWKRLTQRRSTRRRESLDADSNRRPSITEAPCFARLTAKLIRSVSAYLHPTWTNP